MDTHIAGIRPVASLSQDGLLNNPAILLPSDAFFFLRIALILEEGSIKMFTH